MKNALKSALWTVLWTTLVPTLLAVVGWLNDAQQWAADMADGGDQTVSFPDPSVLYGVALGFVFALAAALIVFLVRWAQNTNNLGGESPGFDKAAKP
jgi:hypothetical protein